MSSEIKHPKLELITACEQNFGIGINGELPWSIPSEFAYFVSMTKSRLNSEGKVHASIFGRTTWDETAKIFGTFEASPWKDTICFILSRSMPVPEGFGNVYVCSTFQEVIDHLNRPEIKARVDRVWVHGGGKIYKEALGSPYFYRLYQSRIKASYNSDCFFPRFDESLMSLVHDPDVPQGIQHDNGIEYQVYVFQSNGVNPLLE